MGIMNNVELVDSLLNDLNEALKAQATGQHVKACAIFTGIAQKLINLKAGIESDMKSKDETIEALKERLRACGVEVVERRIDE